MNIKQFFSGFMAFMLAITLAIALPKSNAANGAYYTNPGDPSTCVAIETLCTPIATEEQCEEVNHDDQLVQVFENLDPTKEDGQTTTCGAPLWRIMP